MNYNTKIKKIVHTIIIFTAKNADLPVWENFANFVKYCASATAKYLD